MNNITVTIPASDLPPDMFHRLPLRAQGGFIQVTEQFNNTVVSEYKKEMQKIAERLKEKFVSRKSDKQSITSYVPPEQKEVLELTEEEVVAELISVMSAAYAPA